SLTPTYYAVNPPNANATITFTSSTTKYTLAFYDGSQRIFSNAGYLTAIIDRNGNQATVNLDASSRITSVVDAANRALTFSYQSSSSRQVQSISDSTGTVATYTYQWFCPYACFQRLTQVLYADGSAYNYAYDNSSQLTSVTDKLGHTIETHTYGNDSTRRGLTS